jgi:hypothetical protein
MVAPIGCREPDPAIDWMLFHPAYPPLDGDFGDVWRLLDDAAEDFWRAKIDDGDRPVHTYRQVKDGHRLGNCSISGPDWYVFANDPKLPDKVAKFLRESLPWSMDQIVLYAHRRRCIYRLPWSVFLRHWRRFMMQDESWIFGVERDEFALFADAGGLCVGRVSGQ